MKSAVIAFLTCLLVFYVQGQQDNSSNKCKCSNGYISSRISKQHIKAGPIVHEPSVFCPRPEIIIITTANKQKCVNPQSPLGQLILNNKNKHEKNGAVSKTTASSATSVHTTTASSSTSVHTTSRP
ncbi:uncharacterized protein ABDE67_001114 [Symphorus nematophorus]